MHDKFGYYAALGLSSEANLQQIKTAYRRLVKEFHPDSGFNRDNGATFRLITEAYAVLSDPEGRSDYDRAEDAENRDTISHPRNGIEFIYCEDCGKVAAQPRRLVFWRVTSFLLGTHRTPIQKIYCSICARREQIKSTAWTAILGWWGVPWGPIWALSCGFKNALGGTRDLRLDDALTFQNALAFAIKGQGDTAIALANKVRRSPDNDLAFQANRLIATFAESGCDPASSFKDAWTQSYIRSIALLALVVSLPATAGALIYTQSSDGSLPASTENPRNDPSIQAVGSVELDSQPQKPVQTAPIATCKSDIESGTILTGASNLETDGHKLTIDNGSEGDAVIKIRNFPSQSSFASFYVKQGESATLSGIKDGNYQVQYAFGKLGSKCKKLVTIDAASKFNDVEEFAATITEGIDGSTIVRDHLTYTLYSVPGGNVQPETISPEQFNQ